MGSVLAAFHLLDFLIGRLDPKLIRQLWDSLAELIDLSVIGFLLFLF
jgi:hypothetical protein